MAALAEKPQDKQMTREDELKVKLNKAEAMMPVYAPDPTDSFNSIQGMRHEVNRRVKIGDIEGAHECVDLVLELLNGRKAEMEARKKARS